jgi:hypothetical protein
MEILDHNFLPLALNIGLALSGMIVLLLMIITAVHWRADRQQKHTIAFDRVNEPLLMSYMECNTPQMVVIKSMEGKPLEAMRLLMEFSKKLKPIEQSRLLPLFTGLIAVDVETSALNSPSTKRRLQAAERLGYLKNETSADALLHALEDEVMAVRYCAARSLAAHGQTKHIEATLLAFDTEHEINWLRLVEITCDYGSFAVPTLLSVLENSQRKYPNNIINVAIRALGVLKEPQAVHELIHLLDHSDFSIRLNAARALGDIGDPAAISPIAELSHDPDWAVRNKAVEAIGKLHAKMHIPILTEALSDSSWWVRFSAAHALHSLGHPGIEKLKEIKKSTHDLYAHDMCSQVLGEHGVLEINNNPS